MIDGSARAARYAPANVVVLSPKDAYAILQLLDPAKVRQARNGSLESPIGSLQALDQAAADWATFIRESTPAAPVKAERTLERSVTPRWVADRLNITIQAVLLACREGRIPGATKDNTGWTIPPAGYQHYRDNRSK